MKTDLEFAEQVLQELEKTRVGIIEEKIKNLLKYIESLERVGSSMLHAVDIERIREEIRELDKKESNNRLY